MILQLFSRIIDLLAPENKFQIKHNDKTESEEMLRVRKESDASLQSLKDNGNEDNYCVYCNLKNRYSWMYKAYKNQFIGGSKPKLLAGNGENKCHTRFIPNKG